jgi:hypothetical protein
MIMSRVLTKILDLRDSGSIMKRPPGKPGNSGNTGVYFL